MPISKHYGEWVEIRNRPQCNFGNWDEFKIRGAYQFGRSDVFMKGQEARFYARTLMGLEGKNMWRGYSKDTGEPPGNEAGEATGEGIQLWFRVFFKYKGEGVSYIEFTLTGNDELAPAFCWWFGNTELGSDGNPHPCVIMQVSRNEIEMWLERTGWSR
jgi:hypothetical protein